MAHAIEALGDGGRHRAENDDGPAEAGPSSEKSGGVLLSQGVTAQVPSALTGLTSVFGMGTGMTLSLSPPKLLSWRMSAGEPAPHAEQAGSVNPCLFRTP